MYNNIKTQLQKIKSVFQNRLISSMSLIALTLAVVIAVSVSAHTVKITVDSQTFYVKALQTDPASMLERVNIDFSASDGIQSVKSGKTLFVNLSRSFPVNIEYNNNVFCVPVLPGTTAEDAVMSAGIELDADDLIDCGRNTLLNGAADINVTTIEYITETTVKRIPYQSKTVYDPKSTKTIVKQEGKEGKKEITTIKRYENGVYVGDEETSEKIISNAVTKIVSVGTKKAPTNTVASSSSSQVSSSSKGTHPYDMSKVLSVLKPNINIELDSKGIPVNYKKHMTVQATAYTGKDGDYCATGVGVQVGYIAVNPKVIPYGTKMYIVSSDGKYVYGYAIAADTGGFINKRPTNVDLFMPTEAMCSKFGRRNVEIYILQ